MLHDQNFSTNVKFSGRDKIVTFKRAEETCPSASQEAGENFNFYQFYFPKISQEASNYCQYATQATFIHWLMYRPFKGYIFSFDGKMYSKRFPDRPIYQFKTKRNRLGSDWRATVWHDNVKKNITVSRWVYSAFTGRTIAKNMTIDHLDHDPLNNHIWNLRAVTSSTNNKNRRVAR